MYMNINFIHIPKNAGTSITEAIKKTNIKDVTIKRYVKNNDYHAWNSRLENQLVIIRNPIDRFLSAYKFFVKSKLGQLIRNSDGVYIKEQYIALYYLKHKYNIHTYKDFINICLDYNINIDKFAGTRRHLNKRNVKDLKF